MNKLFKFFLTSAAIAAALVGVVSCQKDYAPDIDSLNQKVAELTQKLSDLQTSISNGEIVTGVTSTANGITVTTNKGSYNITNGKDGKDGTNGKDGSNGKDGTNGKDGSVVTVGENGNWFIDGKDTGLAAAGKNGTNGTDGKNGEYYVPNATTGVFDKYTWNAEKGAYEATPTEIKYTAPGAITAVWNPETNELVFKGIEGKDPYTITLLAEVKSLVFMPRTYLVGVEAMVFDNFTFVPQVLKKGTKDSKREVQVADSTKKIDPKTGKETNEWIDVDPVAVQPAVIAEYHVNPSNADLSFLKEGTSDNLSFVVIEDAEYLLPYTRLAASEDFAVTPIFKSYDAEKGILTVEVQVTGTPAGFATDEEWEEYYYGDGDEPLNLLSVIALNIEKADGEYVTSDYATLMKNDLDDLVIAFKNSFAKDNLEELGKAKDAHLRRADEAGEHGIAEVDDEAYIDEFEAWTEGEMTLDEARETCDISVKYDGSIDLKKIVAAHTVASNAAYELRAANDVEGDKELTQSELDRLGLTWEFAVVKNYRIGTEIDPSLTDQADFVTLEDGVFTPKVFTTSGIAAVGRTPIIRVALKHGDDVVQYAYIKVFISDKEEAPFDAVYDFEDSFGFVCGTADSLLTTVQYMNEKIYNEIKLSAKDFHTLYNAFDDDFDAKIKDDKGKVIPNVGTVEDIVNSETQGTHILKWKITADEAWEYAGKEIFHFVAYYNEKSPEVKAVIKLTAKVDGIQKEYNVLTADYIKNFWNDELTATRYNVSVPTFANDSIPENCVFVNNINYSFETWRKDDVDKAGKQLGVEGLIKLSPVITKVDYFFCQTKGHDIKAPKIDGKDVEFKILKDTVLTAKLKGAAAYDTIAVINNSGEDILNFITLNKESDLAKALLNTKQLYVNIGAKGYVCGDEKKVVKIKFNGEDHFRADYVRPINIADTAADKYIDGVNYGEKGSYLRVEDLIAPSDWRQELDSKKWLAGEYGHNRQFANYPFFWGFYGPFEVEVDLENVKCDLNDRVAAIPKELELKLVSYEDMKDVVTADVYKKLAKTEFGYITYKNNGTGVAKPFNLFMNVKVFYGWGVIDVKDIKVPVSITIEQN